MCKKQLSQLLILVAKNNNHTSIQNTIAMETSILASLYGIQFGTLPTGCGRKNQLAFLLPSHDHCMVTASGSINIIHCLVYAYQYPSLSFLCFSTKSVQIYFQKFFHCISELAVCLPIEQLITHNYCSQFHAWPYTNLFPQKLASSLF